MESPQSSLRVATRKPVSPLLKPVKLEYGKFFKALFSGTKSLVTQDWAKVVSDAIDVAGALNLATTTEELAHTLLQRSITRALFDVVGETNLRALVEKNAGASSVEEMIEQAMNAHPVEIDRHFFDRPMEIALLPELQKSLRTWLVDYGVSEAAAESISKRLPTFFQAAVIDEWRKHASRYSPILEVLESPFARASDRELGWKNYNAYLQQQVERSVFDEPFSLAQIYIPLNAYYLGRGQKDEPGGETREQSAGLQRVVVSLEEELLQWVAKPNPEDLLRVLSGGPGSGKSTFARIFAAKLSAMDGVRVLYIELHQLDATKDLSGEISRYVRDEGLLVVDPLDGENPESNLIIILDGLDELANQGRAAAETARAFVGEVERTLRRKNGRVVRVRVLLSGRELVVQENESEFRRPRQILNLMAYCLSAEGSERKDQPYLDPDGLLERDLRLDWWRNYGKLTGNGRITELPPAFSSDELGEVTSQPLLNYLVALSYTRGRIGFDKAVNLNVIYADLVEAVYERGYDRNRRHISVSHLKPEQFQRVLEEIALAAWHGDGRSTTVREIEEHCRQSKLSASLEKFQEAASTGVTRLLTAFFFRQHGERANTGDKTFIFTHKSFGEFLAACRITRAVERVVKELAAREESPDEGWTEREALDHWAAICGPAACTKYIKDFIRGEFRRKPREEVDRWRKQLAELFSHLVVHGMPMEMRRLKTFPEATYQARNSEETLLVALNATAVVTQTVTYLRFSETQRKAFGSWFRRIQGQDRSNFAGSCLSFLGMPGIAIHGIDFVGADFSYSDLAGVQATFASFLDCNFWCANLKEAQLGWTLFEHVRLAGAHLEGAFLMNARLEGAELENAHLEGAKLNDASLAKAKLNRSNFEGAHLARASLEFASLEVTNFKCADLRGASLWGANLHSADLSNANLQGTNLVKAKLTGADLTSAQLRNAQLEGAELARSYLEGAELAGANLTGANLRRAHLAGMELHRANLKGADLQNAHLEGAELWQAHLEGADLSEAFLEGASFRYAQLEGATMERARLKDADLEGACLRGVDLRRADLRGAKFRNANLRGADLEEAKLENTDFTGADLEGAKMPEGWPEDEASAVSGSEGEASEDASGSVKTEEDEDAEDDDAGTAD